MLPMPLSSDPGKTSNRVSAEPSCRYGAVAPTPRRVGTFGNGLADVWVGAPDPSQDVGGAGSAILVTGGSSGSLGLGEFTTCRAHGVDLRGQLGASLWAGDFDGNGDPDLWAGVPGLRDTNDDNGGAAALFLGVP